MLATKFLVLAAALAGPAVAVPAKGPYANYVTTITQVFNGHTTAEVWTIDPPGSFPTGGTAVTDDVPATVTPVSPVN